MVMSTRRKDRGAAMLADFSGALRALETVVPVKVVETPLNGKTLPTYQPQAGPQTLLETTEADEILFGGAAFGGKTIGVIGALRERVKLRSYHAIVFRRTTKDLKNAIDRAKEVYRDGRQVGAHAFAPFAPAQSGLSRFRQLGTEGGTMVFPLWGSEIVFAHLHTDEAYRAHMGQEYDDVIFDEGPDFTRTQYENLSSRRRGIIPALRRRVIVTANPPEEDQPGYEWIRQKWGPWVEVSAKVLDFDGFDDGGLDVNNEPLLPTHVRLVGLPDRVDALGKTLPPAQSGQVLYVAKDANGTERFSAKPFVWNGVSAEGRTFIAALMSDNKAGLAAESNYASKLNVHNPVRRKQLQEGDWTASRGKGLYFRREWFEPVARESLPPESIIVARVRCWDKAATEPHPKNVDPDWTRGVRGAKLKDGTIIIEDVAGIRAAPGPRDQLILQTAIIDGKKVRIRGPEDPGSGGVGDATSFRLLLKEYIVYTRRVSGSKILRASHPSSMACPMPGAQYGRIKFVVGPWNDAFFAELESFPEGAHDDIVDAFSDVIDELVNHTSEASGKTPAIAAYNPDNQPLGI